MRPTRAITVVIAVALAGSLSLFAPFGNAEEPVKPVDPTPAAGAQEADRMANLERRVEELSRDNARLKQERDAAIAKRKAAEQRVKDLERRLDRPRIQLTPPAQVQPMPERVPENWSPRQFNGITYYVIPLEQRMGRVDRWSA